MDDAHLLHFFGRRLRSARRRAALSQEDLGQRAGVRQDTISHYETGQCRPDLTTLWRLAAALNVEIGYFFPDDRFTAFKSDDIETLALVGSLSPLARQYILTCVRSFAERQQRQQFLLQEVLRMDQQQALLILLDRDIQALDTTLRSGGLSDSTPIEMLVGLTSILLLSLEIPCFNSEMSDVLRRITLSSQRVVRQTLSAKREVVRARSVNG